MHRRFVHWIVFAVGILSLMDITLGDETIDENSTTTAGGSSSSSSNTLSESKLAQQQRREEEKRLWGAPASELAAAHAVGEGSIEQQQHQQHSDHTATGRDANNNHPSALPFLGKSSSSTSPPIPYQYEPPKGFQITARVYTDPVDKLAHFDNDGSIVFPYWECGVSGSSTVPIPLQHATVRHLLGGSKPNLYSGEEFGPHPQLVIALTSLEVVLNSGQVQTFSAGDVLLLEDVVSGGHKLKGSGQNDMTVMILTLPDHYHQVGKDKSSLKRILAKAGASSSTNSRSKQHTVPCYNPGRMTELDVPAAATTTETAEEEEELSMADKVTQALQKLQPRSIRRYVLGMLGLSISTLLGDFMGKVAPLWLAVVFGGGCFVTGGTYCFVKVGDYCLDEIEMWQERRQLQIQDGVRDNPNDGNHKNNLDGEYDQTAVPKVEELFLPKESHLIQ